MLNVIVLNNDTKLRTSKIHFYKIFSYLVEKHDFGTVILEELINKSVSEIKNLFLERFNAMPDNLIFYEHVSQIKEINIPTETKINIIIDDLHHQGEIKRKKIDSMNKSARILSTYGYCFNKFYKSINVPVYWLPHCATFNIDFNQNPINKILVSGRLHREIYPFRQLMYKMSKKNKLVEYLSPNCEYWIDKDNEKFIYGERYMKKLNQYLVCFTCDACPQRPYLVAKHFEIAASGALLLAGNPSTKTYFAKLGFIDGVHYISTTMGNINDKIAYVLDPQNREEIDRIRLNGYEYAKAKHYYQNRAEYLNNIINNKNDRISKQTDGINGTIYHTENMLLGET